MKIYNSEPVNARPRVLGLFASLINSSIKLEMFYDSVNDLEKTYSAVCITSYVTELCGTNPEEVICSYDSQSNCPNVSAQYVIKALGKFIECFDQIIRKTKNKMTVIVIRLQKCLINVRNMLTDSRVKTTINPGTQQKYPVMIFFNLLDKF
jgi:hypothetical protein